MKQHERIAVALLLGIATLGSGVGVAGPRFGLGDTALDETLLQSGWAVSRSRDGSILLYPPQVRPKPGDDAVLATDEVTEAKEAGDLPASTGGAAAAAVPDWDRLRDLGWQVKRAEDGSTLLYPPILQVATPTEADAEVAEPAPDAEVAESAQAPDAKLAEPAQAPDAEVAEPAQAPDAEVAEPAQALDALLQARGWRVERDVAGSLLLYPRDRTVEVTPCAGVETALVQDGEIALPVDSWMEAKAIASAWLKAHGAPDWQVGKIRQVHQVYLISILDSARPASLVHQIAVRVGSGVVVVLN